MKAIVLAGGLGTRMQMKIPKALIQINGKPILGYLIDSLESLNIKKFILLTGYKSNQIERFVNENYPDLDIKFVNDSPEQKGGYICSLSGIEDVVDEDIIFMHGDLVCDSSLIKKMIKDERKNLALTHIDPDSVSKDFKAIVENGIIKKISVGIRGNLVMPLYKFSKESFRDWLDSINILIGEGQINIHAEEAIEFCAYKIKLKPLYYKEELCMEVDNQEDLKKAESMISRNY